MIDFQEAYGWLYQFDALDSFLSESAKRFESPIQEALTNQDFANLDEPITQILKIAQSSTKILEKGEICLLCARAYYAKAEIEIANADINIEAAETKIAEARLEKAKAELEKTKGELEIKRAKERKSKVRLDKAKFELEKAKVEWVKAEAGLDKAKDELNKAEAEREKAKGELGKALELMDEAGNLYKSNPHQYAVVQWLKGCTYLKMKKNQPEALQYWQNGLDTFERLKVQYRIDKQGIDWYQKQCEKMRQSIQQVKLDDRP
jgi:chromosome segregation ATPase